MLCISVKSQILFNHYFYNNLIELLNYLSTLVGSTTSYPQLTRDCGEISNNVNSTGNTALISFTSDGSHTTRGFKYEITSIDGGKYIATYAIKLTINSLFILEVLHN